MTSPQGLRCQLNTPNLSNTGTLFCQYQSSQSILPNGGSSKKLDCTQCVARWISTSFIRRCQSSKTSDPNIRPNNMTDRTRLLLGSITCTKLEPQALLPASRPSYGSWTKWYRQLYRKRLFVRRRSMQNIWFFIGIFIWEFLFFPECKERNLRLLHWKVRESKGWSTKSRWLHFEWFWGLVRAFFQLQGWTSKWYTSDHCLSKWKNYDPVAKVLPSLAKAIQLMGSLAELRRCNYRLWWAWWWLIRFRHCRQRGYRRWLRRGGFHRG